MHKLSSVLAFITNKIFIILLIITVLGLAQVVAVAQVITNKDKVKAVLTESNLYTNLPQNAIYVIKLDTSEQTQEGAQTAESSKTLYESLEDNEYINPDDVNRVIVKVISPEFLQQQVEGLIDNSYSFLSQDVPELTFSFSLKERSEAAQNEINAILNEKLAALPVCTFEQLLQIDPNNIDILEAPCLPPGISLQSKINEFTNELTANEGIFAQEFTQKDAQISNVDANLAKYIYSSLKNLIWMFWLLILAYSAVIVLTSKTLHRGLKVVGSILVVTGLLLLGSYLLYIGNYNFAENSITSNQDLSPREAEALNTVVSPIYSSFVDQVVNQITVISLILIALGILLFVLGILATKHHIEHLYLPKHKKEPQPVNAETKSDETPPADPEDKKGDHKPNSQQ